MSTEIQNHPAYRRVLLKISGEALVGEQTFGIDVNVARSVAASRKAQAAWIGLRQTISACWLQL